MVVLISESVSARAALLQLPFPVGQGLSSPFTPTTVFARFAEGQWWKTMTRRGLALIVVGYFTGEERGHSTFRASPVYVYVRVHRAPPFLLAI